MFEHVPFRRMADIIRHHAAEHGPRTALIYEQRETSYRKLDDRASRVANALIAEGVVNQSRIAILAKNTDIFFEIYFGAGKCGAVPVPINFRLSAQEVQFIINDARAELLFVGADYYDLVARIRDELSTVSKVIALDGEHPQWPDYISWRDVQSGSDPARDGTADETCLQVYSSGTTGYPKGVELTHDNLTTLLAVAVQDWGDWSEAEISMVVMPLFHVAGCEWALAAFWAGATNLLLREVEPQAILAAIPRYRVTKMLIVPAVVRFLLQTPGCRETDYTSLDSLFYGASPIPLPVLQQALEVFQCGFYQLYGLTETSGAVTCLYPHEHHGTYLQSCGRPVRSARIRVIDAAGNDCPPGRVGEIVVAGGQIMKAYWNRCEATQQAIRDGWFHSGDAGYFDDEGYLYIYDRIKDMIVSGGENIYPTEIESALAAHPRVADVGVIGIPDDTWGESVLAFIVMQPGACPGEAGLEAELDAFARTCLAGYKIPKHYRFVEQLPRNASGKILKRELRAPFWAGQTRQVH